MTEIFETVHKFAKNGQQFELRKNLSGRILKINLHNNKTSKEVL